MYGFAGSNLAPTSENQDRASFRENFFLKFDAILTSSFVDRNLVLMLNIRTITFNKIEQLRSFILVMKDTSVFKELKKIEILAFNMLNTDIEEIEKFNKEKLHFELVINKNEYMIANPDKGLFETKFIEIPNKSEE